MSRICWDFTRFISANQLQLDHTCEVQDGVNIENREIVGRESAIPIRIYRHSNAEGPTPFLVYYHCGAWVIGGLDEWDGVCSYLCRYGNVTVGSIDYRVAPEHKFPAAVIDSIDAVNWVAENVDGLGSCAERIGVAGDSAGGNLAAVVCQQLRSSIDVTISRQVLLYPCLAPHDPDKYPSRSAYGGEECFLNEVGFEHMLGLYRRSLADNAFAVRINDTTAVTASAP